MRNQHAHSSTACRVGKAAHAILTATLLFCAGVLTRADTITLSVAPAGHSQALTNFVVPSNVVAQVLYAWTAVGGDANLYVTIGGATAYYSGYSGAYPTGPGFTNLPIVAGPATITLWATNELPAAASPPPGPLTFCTILTTTSGTSTQATTLASGGGAAAATFNVPSNVAAQITYAYLVNVHGNGISSPSIFSSGIVVSIGAVSGASAYYGVALTGPAGDLPIVVGPAAITLGWSGNSMGYGNWLSFCTIQTFPAMTSYGAASMTRTNIGFSAVGDKLRLTWPLDHTGWRLEADTNLLNAGLSTGWVSVPGSTLTNQMALPISRTNPTVFYRLAYP